MTAGSDSPLKEPHRTTSTESARKTSIRVKKKAARNPLCFLTREHDRIGPPILRIGIEVHSLYLFDQNAPRSMINYKL